MGKTHKRMFSEESRDYSTEIKNPEYRAYLPESLGVLELKPMNKRMSSFLGKENSHSFQHKNTINSSLMDQGNSISKFKIDHLSRELDDMLLNVFKNRNEMPRRRFLI